MNCKPYILPPPPINETILQIGIKRGKGAGWFKGLDKGAIFYPSIEEEGEGRERVWRYMFEANFLKFDFACRVY